MGNEWVTNDTSDDDGPDPARLFHLILPPSFASSRYGLVPLPPLASLTSYDMIEDWKGNDNRFQEAYQPYGHSLLSTYEITWQEATQDTEKWTYGEGWRRYTVRFLHSSSLLILMLCSLDFKKFIIPTRVVHSVHSRLSYGTPVFTWGVTRDITAREMMIETRRESEWSSIKPFVTREPSLSISYQRLVFSSYYILLPWLLMTRTQI